METAHRCQRFVSAPEELVRQVLADPAELGKWLVAGGQAPRSDAGGGWTKYRKRRQKTALRQRLAGGPGGPIVWRSEIAAGSRCAA